MISLLVLIMSIILASIALGRHAWKKDSRLPPGSMGWPFIGETLSLVKPHPATWRGDFLENRIPKFGKFFSSHLFGTQAIVSADPELNRLILKNEGAMFESAFPYTFKKLMNKSVSADAHKDRRSLFLKFFNTERLQTVILPNAEQLASQLLDTWKEGSIISATEEANKFAFYFTVKELLNMDFEEPVVEELRRAYLTFGGGLTALPVYIPGTRYWKAFESRTYILNFLKQKAEEKIRQKRNHDESIGRDDFLKYTVKNTDDLTEEISAPFLNLLFASYHTTSHAISSMFYFLKHCPKAVEQLREEWLQLIKPKLLKGESPPTLDDYRNMEFTHCVIMEILRLSHVAPVIFRKPTSDFYFKGYVIPRGCHMILHTSGMHLDPMLFEDPQHFNPWRWINHSGINRNYAFMPFGGGPRLCAGNVLAQLEMIVFLHHFLTKYEWELVEQDVPMSTPATVFAKGLKIKVHKL